MERFLEEDIELKVIHGLMKRVEYETKGEYIILSQFEWGLNLKEIDWKCAADYSSKMNTEQSCYGSILQNRQFVRFCDGKAVLTLLGALLFFKRIDWNYPFCFIHVACYGGIRVEFDENDNMIQEETFNGTLPQMTRMAADFIAARLKEYARRRMGTPFQDIPEFPDYAWKELLLNSVIHHSYRNFWDQISILMFDDRIEIFNHVFLDSDPQQDLPDGAVSQRAARLYGPNSHTAHLAPFQGLRRVFEQMEKAPLPAPEFYMQHITFGAVLRNRPKSEEE